MIVDPNEVGKKPFPSMDVTIPMQILRGCKSGLRGFHPNLEPYYWI